MKVKQYVKPAGRNRVLTYIAAAIIALMVFAVSMLVVKPQPAVHAETGGKVTVHVYDPAQEYSKLGAWLWVKGAGDGNEYKISTSAASDEQFFIEYTQNGTRVKNASRTFTMELTEAQVTAAKGGSAFGMLICSVNPDGSGDFWGRYSKETSDVLVQLDNAFDANNNAHVYYVRKDAVAYTDLQEALKTLEKVNLATFTAKTAQNVTVAFETTVPIQKTAQATLYEGKTVLAKASITIDSQNACKGTAKFATVFDFSKNYRIEVDNITTGCSVTKTGFIDDADFINTFECADTQNQKYGAIYSATSTTFRVWAPFASSVKLNTYPAGTGGTPAKFNMTKRMPSSGTWGGVWEYTLNGDQKGKYYTYSITNGGAETETIDPYAKACGANGLRGMVVDLDSTDPAGWAADKTWYTNYATEVDTPIIWEVTVADFSSSSDSGMKYKGKYLAFTEQGTTVPGKPSLKTGVNYLKDLGITYVHLNPVYDFATVDEADMTRADGGSFNWGYDPQNYNIPEGSYSTDPANGAVRINEFKRMVKALHDAGIGVVMDVVYNHTYSTGGQALHDTVPYYYHRTNENGNFTNGSGCGNETASERTMVRKYIIDSMTYWAEEYHIDGFRFDLMGLHDLETIKQVRTALDKVNNKILIYGEPWSADGKYVPPSFANRLAASKTGVTGYAVNPSDNVLVKNMFAGYDSKNALGRPESNYPRNMSALPNRVAVFNDSGREGIRGSNDPGKGWVSGDYSDKKIEKIMKMLEGGAGTSGDGMQTNAGSRSVAYAAAHDNYTLWDQIRGYKHFADSPLSYDAPIQDTIKQCKLAAAVYLTSSGMSFMLAGDEMGRTKYGNENSYNSPVKLNQIVWSRQEKFSELYQFNKKLIGLRKKYSSQLFSYSKSTQASFCYCNFDRSGESSGTIKYTRPLTNPVMTVTLTATSSTHTGTIKIGTDTLTI